MAWLSGLAGKAENLLNKIDQNTAAVLNKEKYDVSVPQLTDVTWTSLQLRDDEGITAKSEPETSKKFSLVRSLPNVRSLTPTSTSVPKEDELMKFLNTPSASPKRNGPEIMTPPTPSSLVVEHPTDNTDSISELSIHSGRTTPDHTHISVDLPDIEDHESKDDIQNHTLFIETEVEKASSSRYGDSIVAVISEENSESNLQKQFDPLKDEYKFELKGQENDEIDPLATVSESSYIRKQLQGVKRNFKDRNEFLEKQETDHQKEITVLNEKVQSLESEKMQLLKQLLNLQSTLERNRSDLNSTRSDLEQHRARALKTLQEKEKLIAELKSNVTSGMDDATIMELNQLRQERDVLREENQQLCEQLSTVREELSNADLKLEKMRQESTEAGIQAQEFLMAERRRRLDAEEDARLHLEEIRSQKDELFRQHNSFTLKLQKQDSEISRLKLQLSASITPSSEVESRLTSLTQTLVLKQQALESLTTERNALRLQLEKIEHEFRTAMGSTRRNTTYNNVNDTDDAKAQVPTFLMETPFDTGVTRRVKRAYSSLDAISVRTGVFLRRYPLARILVLIYMALLQFWVFVVLLSQSPDAH